MSKKYQPYLFKVTKNPVIIVGQNPGRLHSSDSSYAWRGGTRSSKCLEEILEGRTNYILTNICNYQEMTQQNVDEGVKDLFNLIDQHQPSYIICLGAISYAWLQEIDPLCKIYAFYHPSYIMRFNKDVERYKLKIREVLKHG